MKMKTKTTNIIQRLCLFLFVLVLAAPAWATATGVRAMRHSDHAT